jgi:Trk-type K+ transport system membrane component
MNLKSVVTYFRFSKSNRLVFCLLFVVVIFFNFVIFLILVEVVDDPDKQSWMANQIIDSLKNSYSRAVPKLSFQSFYFRFKGYRFRYVY